MRLIKENSPHINKNSSVKRMMLDVLIALIPVVIFAIYEFGFKAVSVLLISVCTMLVSEIVFVFLVNKKPYDGEKQKFKDRIKYAYSKATINNILTPIISGVIYAMIMPAGCSWYITFIGALSGIVLGKLVFGGLGANIFNPAAVGRVITMVCFASKMTYPAVDAISGATPLGALANDIGVINFENIKNLLIGTVSGSMGEVSKICILAGGIYLIIRRSADFRVMLAVILSFAFVMFFGGIKSEANTMMYLLYQVLSGGLLFGAIFMATDPVTSPVTRPGRITFGILIGVISALIRLIGAYPEGVAFAILIVNMFVPVIDYYKWSTNKYSWKHFLLWGIILALCCVIVILGV